MWGIQSARSVSELAILTSKAIKKLYDAIVSNKSDSDAAFQDLISRVYPTGIISEFGGSSAPEGFLLCDGAAVSRSKYSKLFMTIGTSFGAGDGVTTFNVPNLQGLVPRGAGTQEIGGRTKDGGALGTVLEDQMQRIEGSINKGSSNGGLVGGQAGVDIQTTGVFSHTTVATGIVASGSGYRYLDFTFNSSNSPNARTSSTTSGETRVSSLAVNYIIKY